MRSEPSATARHGAGHDLDAELDRLVAAEVAELTPPPAPPAPAEEPIEAALQRLGERLRGHPEREALLERLRAVTLGESAAGAPAGDVAMPG
jgi:hypothetical protein